LKVADLPPFELKNLQCVTLGKAYSHLKVMSYDPEIRGGPRKCAFLYI
jgi:hypothetical protein